MLPRFIGVAPCASRACESPASRCSGPTSRYGDVVGVAGAVGDLQRDRALAVVERRRRKHHEQVHRLGAARRHGERILRRDQRSGLDALER